MRGLACRTSFFKNIGGDCRAARANVDRRTELEDTQKTEHHNTASTLRDFGPCRTSLSGSAPASLITAGSNATSSGDVRPMDLLQTFRRTQHVHQLHGSEGKQLLIQRTRTGSRPTQMLHSLRRLPRFTGRFIPDTYRSAVHAVGLQRSAKLAAQALAGSRTTRTGRTAQP